MGMVAHVPLFTNKRAWIPVHQPSRSMPCNWYYQIELNTLHWKTKSNNQPHRFYLVLPVFYTFQN